MAGNYMEKKHACVNVCVRFYGRKYLNCPNNSPTVCSIQYKRTLKHDKFSPRAIYLKLLAAIDYFQMWPFYFIYFVMGNFCIYLKSSIMRGCWRQRVFMLVGTASLELYWKPYPRVINQERILTRGLTSCNLGGLFFFFFSILQFCERMIWVTWFGLEQQRTGARKKM